jgi:DNA polymerase zeta
MFMLDSIQVSGQAAMECIPLVMEPRSRFYTSPVVVLDFQVRTAATAHALLYLTTLTFCIKMRLQPHC